MSHFDPHISPNSHIKEFSFRAVSLGLLFGLFFAIANAYLALKIGTTISASIPAAILSMAILKYFFQGSTLLENNIVQTIATVGEGLAAGVVFTIPALLLLGDTPSIEKIFLLSATGGILGILFMIPMRRFIIVDEHKKLPFPEGTACAEILKAGESKERSAALMALYGFLGATVYKIASNALFLWNEVLSWTVSAARKVEFSLDATPALLGVGYIVGPRITGAVFAGGLFAWWGLIPMIAFFGGDSGTLYPAAEPIRKMGADALWDAYIRYIGAGALGMGGILSLFKIFPILTKTVKVTFHELFKGVKERQDLPRTDRDISMRWLFLGAAAILLFLLGNPLFNFNFLTIALLIALSFLFVAVTSFTVGLVGSTSNPVSGMTLATLLITCLIFVSLGWTERAYLLSAMSMGVVSCCAICMAGTTSQDLKTGFLLGATPRLQQIGEMMGVLLPSLALGSTVYILNEAYGVGSATLPAPQATLMALLVEGVIQGDLPYLLVGVGAILALAMACVGIPVIAFALGLYLPLSLTTGMMVGALARSYVNWQSSESEIHQRGTLFSSGLIGGDACVGILLALLTVLGIIPPSQEGDLPDLIGLAAYLLLAALFAFYTVRKKGA